MLLQLFVTLHAIGASVVGACISSSVSVVWSDAAAPVVGGFATGATVIGTFVIGTSANCCAVADASVAGTAGANYFPVLKHRKLYHRIIYKTTVVYQQVGPILFCNRRGTIGRVFLNLSIAKTKPTKPTPAYM